MRLSGEHDLHGSQGVEEEALQSFKVVKDQGTTAVVDVICENR